VSDVLFVTVDGGGNVPPALGIAREIARRGGVVRFLGHEAQRGHIEGAGFRFQPFERGMDYDAAAPRSTFKGVMDLTRLFADTGIGKDAVKAASAESTDIVVVDTLIYRAVEDTVRAGLPVVQLMHTFSGFHASAAKGPLGMISRMRGAHPAASLKAPKLTLVTTRPEFDENAMPGVKHTGFIWQGTPVEATPRSTPRILLSFSTTSFPGQAAAMQRAIDGLGELDAEVIVTTGPSIDPNSIRPARNTTIARFIDHGEILPTTSLVISHGGHSTMSRALAYGIPMLVRPSHPLADQPRSAAVIERLGLGLSIAPKASAAAFRDAAAHVLADDGIRDRARTIGRDIRAKDGAVVAMDLMEAFAGTDKIWAGSGA